MRNVAKRVGVSHAAPYNHFADKQGLLSAISTAGHEHLHRSLVDTFSQCNKSSTEIVVEIAWAYYQFAMDNPDQFKLMFSGALEEERSHPDYVEISQKTIALFEEIIAFCQAKGQLPASPVNGLAVKLWSSVHGFTTLMLENQFPPEYLQEKNIKELLKSVLE